MKLITGEIAAQISAVASVLVEARVAEWETPKGRKAQFTLTNLIGHPPELAVHCDALRFAVDGKKLHASVEDLLECERLHDMPPAAQRVELRVLPGEELSRVYVFNPNTRRGAKRRGEKRGRGRRSAVRGKAVA